MKEMTDGDRAMQAFLADCEKKSAIELDHYMRGMRLSATWKFAAQRILDSKRVEEAIDRQHEADDLARRSIAAAESQAASARSANKRATLALVVSVIAIIVAGAASAPDLIEFFKLAK